MLHLIFLIVVIFSFFLLLIVILLSSAMDLNNLYGSLLNFGALALHVYDHSLRIQVDVIILVCILSILTYGQL